VDKALEHAHRLIESACRPQIFVGYLTIRVEKPRPPLLLAQQPPISPTGLNVSDDLPEPLLLLVEDEPLVLLVAQDALEAGGYTVLPVQLASEALNLLNGRIGDFSGLITDIRLPGGADGWEIARHARNLRGDIPVVYTTSDGAADWPAKGVPNSVIIQKPYAGAQLLTAISTLMTTADTNRTA
jgi:CheY-like chemotaxis protein